MNPLGPTTTVARAVAVVGGDALQNSGDTILRYFQDTAAGWVLVLIALVGLKYAIKSERAVLGMVSSLLAIGLASLCIFQPQFFAGTMTAIADALRSGTGK